MKWEKNEERVRIFRSYFHPFSFVADTSNYCKTTAFVFTVDTLITKDAFRSKPNVS
jgi:hypothetical protein